MISDVKLDAAFISTYFCPFPFQWTARTNLNALIVAEGTTHKYREIYPLEYVVLIALSCHKRFCGNDSP